MGRDLATRAELVKLARALDATPEEVSFAVSLDHADIRRLRERIVAALYEEHRATFGRIAMITRLLPTPLNVRITLRAFSPLLAARIAGEMAPDRAAELVNRMPVEYLADGCVHLEPRRAAPLISHIHPDRVVAVVQELVARGDHVTIGRLLDAATERIVRDVAAVLSDEDLLLIGCYAESDTQLTTAVAALPPERLRAIVARAAGSPDLRSAGLALIGRLTDPGLRTRLAEYAAESSDETLTGLLHTAIDDGAVPELLTLVATLAEPTQRRILALPALTDPDILNPLIEVATAHPLHSRLVPLLKDQLHRHR
jgi:hypothetical protein